MMMICHLQQFSAIKPLQFVFYVQRRSGVQPQLKSWSGPRFGSEHWGACTPGRPKAGLGVGCRRETLLPLWGFGGITPGKCLGTEMLNPAFWWLLAVKLLAFWKLWPRSGDQYTAGPQPKSLGTSLHRPYGCCSYGGGSRPGPGAVPQFSPSSRTFQGPIPESIVTGSAN